LRVSFGEASAFDAATSGIGRLSASLNTKDSPTENEFAAMVDRLVDVAAFRRAVDMELAWMKAFPGSLRRAQIESSIVTHLYSLRANAEARERGEAFLKQNADNPEAHDVYITLFRLDVREGRTVEVERRGRAILAGSVPGVALGDRQAAARLLAEYLVSVGQAPKAVTVYNQLYKMTTGRGARIDVLWRIAIASLRAGQRAQAIKQLQQILQLRPDSETERAASFWLAYAQNASGDKSSAQLRWRSLALNQPFTYYGLRAANWLAEAPRPEPLAFPALTLRDLVLDHPDYQAAALVSRAGMPIEAATYARRLNSAFRKDDAVALLAARASEAAGDYSSASTLMLSYFGPYLQRPATNLPDDFWTLAYPRAYWTEVSASAARYKIDPLLMLGLARQESHFDRAARSTVGAVGLFQVMPYTAVELDPSFSTPSAMDRLVDPGVSAELGAKLLASLQARFQGSLAPTIASYNADKERVQVWWDTSKGLPEELFIDSIPYQQTRAYVRQVLTNYAMYQRSARPASPQK
jgi:soluble lytic murein transglycosylase